MKCRTRCPAAAASAGPVAQPAGASALSADARPPGHPRRRRRRCRRRRRRVPTQTVCEARGRLVDGRVTDDYLSYHYIYDETNDQREFYFWQWLREELTHHFFANNSYCEDGQASTGLGSGQPTALHRRVRQCQQIRIGNSGRIHGGCGKQNYVPCQLGYDCNDCGPRQVPVSRRRRALEDADGEAVLPSVQDRASWKRCSRR